MASEGREVSFEGRSGRFQGKSTFEGSTVKQYRLEAGAGSEGGSLSEELEVSESFPRNRRIPES